MTAGQPPLLVTGLPRTGTSWVGKMLEASREVVYVNEPLNPRHPPGHSPGVLDADVTHQFQYICEDNEEVWLSAFRRTTALRYGFAAELGRNRRPYDLARLVKYGTAFTLGRLRGRRAMLDDPFAVLSAPWFAQRLGAQVVVLVRDPLAVAGSYRKLGWHVRFEELTDQPLLVRDLLAGVSADLRAAPDDPVHRFALLWRTVYDVVDREFRKVPGVTVRRYEDLATRPEEEFADLYRWLGLSWSDRAARLVRAATSGSGDDSSSHRWSMRSGLSKTAFRPMDSRAALESYRRRLTDAEIATVREVTSDVAARLYAS